MPRPLFPLRAAGRRLGRPARILAVALAGAALVAAIAVPPASAATPAPPTPSGLPTGVEALAAYVGANSCDASAKPGSSALGTLLTNTYRGTTFHVARPCGSDSLSTTEHYDGRAVDWMVNGRNTTQRAYATAALNWMLATDGRGNRFANARRLGVMYLIWNNRTWSSYRADQGWREYNGCLAASKAGTAYDTACHRNHVHISLSWEGAMKRSSFWSKSVARPEFGPCRTPYLNWAPPSSRANLSRCATPAQVVTRPTASSLGKQLVSYSGMYVREGRTGPVVTAVQQAIGTTATGTFSSTTRSALVAWQKRQGISATGVTDASTWRHLTRRHARQPVAQGLDADYRSDLLTRDGDGLLQLHGSTYPSGRTVGWGWHIFDTILGAGDFSGDGAGDVLARKPDGTLWLYAGTGTGGFRSGARVGSGWQVFNALISPGDFTGDGFPDVLARRPDGSLWLYAANGRGGWSVVGKRVGSGWQGFDRLVSPGDFTGDGHGDVLARRQDGSLWLYAGNGRGGWSVIGQQVGRGWQVFDEVIPGGDRNGDGRSDVLALQHDGTLLVYAGNGRGGWASGGQVAGRGWNSFDTVVGIR